jgi:hypothetical protein
MPLTQELAAQANPGSPLSGVAQSVTNGLDAGLAYAAAKQKSSAIEEQLTQMKEQQAMKRDEYTLDALDKAAKAKNPKFGKIIIDSLSKTRESWGLPPIDPDTANLMNTEEGKAGIAALVKMYPDFIKNPESRAQFTDGLSRITGQGPVESIKAANELAESFTKIANQESLDRYRGDLADVRGQNLDLRTQALNNTKNRQTSTDIRAANGILKDPAINKEVIKLNAANSAKSLMEAIKSGEVKDSKNISRQLTNIIATIEMGSPGGVADRKAMGVDTLYSKAQGLLGYIESKPTSTIPKQYIGQLDQEINALGDRAAKNYHNLSQAAIAGADTSFDDPDADKGQVFKLAKQKRDALLKNSGYNPETGEKMKKGEAAAPVSTGPKRLPPDVIKQAAAKGSTFQQAQFSAQKKGYVLTQEEWQAAGGK